MVMPRAMPPMAPRLPARMAKGIASTMRMGEMSAEGIFLCQGEGGLGIVEEDAGVGVGVGLVRLGLDLVAKGVLGLVGVGEIGVVENQKSAGENNAGEKQREGKSVEADAAGFEGDDFVVFTED